MNSSAEIEVGKLLISREEGFDPACVPCLSFVTTVQFHVGEARLLKTYTCHPEVLLAFRSGSLFFCGWEGWICPINNYLMCSFLSPREVVRSWINKLSSRSGIFSQYWKQTLYLERINHLNLLIPYLPFASMIWKPACGNLPTQISYFISRCRRFNACCIGFSARCYRSIHRSGWFRLVVWRPQRVDRPLIQ